MDGLRLEDRRSRYIHPISKELCSVKYLIAVRAQSALARANEAVLSAIKIRIESESPMREIDAVREFIAQARPKDGPPLPWAERRTRIDAFGAMMSLADGWSITADALGRPADRHHSALAKPGRVMLYLHGGGYCIGSPQSHRALISQLANAAQAETFALDYRLAPEHPMPAAIEDVLAALAALNARGVPTEQILMAGDSAGGGLALAAALRLRDAGKPLPAALYLISPWVDLTLSGRAHKFRAASDPILTTQELTDYADAYVGPKDRAGQDASPMFADMTGLPPMLIQVGSDEILLSDSETLQARAADQGVMAALEVWPGMIHVWHIFHTMLGSARDAIADAGLWMGRRWE
jgi:acetyl esterase/lipase